MINLKILVPFIIGFITLIVLDYIWLGYITKDFIIREFGNLIKSEEGRISINIGVGLLAWLVISIMVVLFVTLKSDSYSQVLINGAILGFLSYSMYDLTNLTFITNYSIKFTIVDIIWGTFACSIVALNSYYFYNLIK